MKFATILGLSALVYTANGQECVDDPDASFGGYACADWAGYPCCDPNVTQMDAEGMAALMAGCPASCNSSVCPIEYCEAVAGPAQLPECTGDEPALVDYDIVALDIFAVDCAGLVRMGYCTPSSGLTADWAAGKPGAAMIINVLSHMVCPVTCREVNNHEVDENMCNAAQAKGWESLEGHLCEASRSACFQSHDSQTLAGMLFGGRPCGSEGWWADGLRYPGDIDDYLFANVRGYPGTDHGISGGVAVTPAGHLDLQLKDFGEEVSQISVHIHTGTSCRYAEEVGGHYYAGEEDGWNDARWTIPTSDNMAEATVEINSGISYEENEGHVVVVHDHEGNRIGCGKLWHQAGLCHVVKQKRAICGGTCPNSGIADDDDMGHNCMALNVYTWASGTTAKEEVDESEMELKTEYEEWNCASDEFCAVNCYEIEVPEGEVEHVADNGNKYIFIYLDEEAEDRTMISKFEGAGYVYCEDSAIKGMGNYFGNCAAQSDACICPEGIIKNGHAEIPCVCPEEPEEHTTCHEDADCEEGFKCHFDAERRLLFGNQEGHCA